VVVDPKGKDFSIYRGASLITPNLNEFETIVGGCADEHELVSKGAQLMHDLDLGALLVTRGEHGMTLLRSPQEMQRAVTAMARGLSLERQIAPDAELEALFEDCVIALLRAFTERRSTP